MKKLLALVLAMVMTLGLATVGASAAAYTDADSIDFKEAVEVMSALKVFDGQNGAFNPNGILTREQGAKIIAYMILGKSAADSLTTAKSSFADVAPERWSAGAIEYCVSTKIVGGAGKDANGNDVFNPEAELTGYAFAKMCLVALGYNPNYENFVGGDWAINVAKVAADAGLDKDLASLVMSKGITREQAAQMALNTEKATMVDYKNPINVKGSDGMEVTVNAERNKLQAGSYNYHWNGGTNNGTDEDSLYVQFVERYNQSPKVYLESNTDDFGRPANVWKQGNATIGKYGKTPTLTYTAGVKGGVVYTDLGGSSIDFANMAWNGAGNNRFTFHVDGVKVTNSIGDVYTKDFAAVIARGNTTDTVSGTGNGVKTEIFYNRADNTLDVVQTRTYLVKANAAYDATRKSLNVTVQTNSGATSVSAITSISGTDFPVVEGAAKDTYFYITADANGSKATVKTVTPLAADRFLSGVTISSKSGSSMVADGTSYSVAKICPLDPTSDLTLQSTKYDFILDPYGYVLSSSQTSSNTEYKDKYIFVNEVDKLGLSAQARIIKMDGTTATVTVSKSTTSTTDGSKPTAVAGVYNDEDTVVANWAKYSANAYVVSKAFYTYTVNDDGSYSLTYKTTGNATAQLVKNSPSQIGVGTMNSKTAFVVGSNTSSLSAYLGVANFPGTSNSAKYYFALNNGTVAALYSMGSASNSSADKYVFLFRGSTEAQDSATSSPYYLYDAFIDGAKSADKLAVADSSAAVGLYKVSYNSKNQLVTSDNYVTGGSTAFGVFDKAWMDAGNGNITVTEYGGSHTATYTLSSGAEFYYVDCYNSDNSVTYTDAAAAKTRTAQYESCKIVVVQKSSSDKSIDKVFIITNASYTGAKNW